MQSSGKSDLADVSFYGMRILVSTHCSCTIALFSGPGFSHVPAAHPSFLFASTASFHTSTSKAIKMKRVNCEAH